MMNANILFLSCLTGLATLFGVFLGSFFKKTKNNIVFSASFAASLMIFISVFELIPAAAEKIELKYLFLWVFLGIFLVWIANQVIPHLHSVREIKNCKDKCLVKMSYLIATGLILHDFPEGFAIAGSFGSSDSLGLLVAMAAFIHNVPEGYILTIFKPKSGNRYSSYKLAALSALATFLGAVLGIWLLSFFQNLNPIFLALAAGAMLFIAIHELLPESCKDHRAGSFMLGIISSVVVYFFLYLI